MHRVSTAFDLMYSCAGYVARQIARIEPERVQALMLIASFARADTPE